MTTSSEPEGKPDASDFAFAQMLHNGDLATWVVQTAGRALTALLAPAFIGAVVSGVTGQPVFIGLGSLLGVFIFLLFLTGATAPFPRKEVIAYLEDDDPDSSSDPNSAR